MKKLFLALLILVSLSASSQITKTITQLPTYVGSLNNLYFPADISPTQTRKILWATIESQMVTDSLFASYRYIWKIRDSLAAVINGSIPGKLNVSDSTIYKTKAASQKTTDSTWAAITSFLAGKQATLVSGTNIKTINGVTILGSGDLVITSGVSSVFSRSGVVTAQSGDYSVGQITGAAPLASPTFTGTPAAPTAANSTNTTQVATTAFVQNAIAPLTAGGYALNNINEFRFVYTGSSTFTFGSAPGKIISVKTYNGSAPMNNPSTGFTWGGGTSFTVTDPLVTGDTLYALADMGTGGGLPLTTGKYFNGYGGFPTLTLDSANGGTLINNSKGFIGFPQLTNSPASIANVIQEFQDSAGNRALRYPNGFIREFNRNISANRTLAWPDGNAIDTLATQAWARANISGGAGAVSSVSNADGTLTISPTTGSVVASLALGHANTWTAAQSFNGTYTASATIDKVFTIAPTITQTSTGGYTGIFESVFQNTTGSGAKLLMDLGTNSAANGGGTHTSKFSVDNLGVINAGGNATFGGDVLAPGFKTSVTSSNSSFWATSSTGGQTQTAALPTAAGTDWMRRYLNNNSNSAVTAGADYTGTIFGPEPITIAASGTHNLFTNVAILPNVITTGVGTLTEASTLWIKDAPNLGASKYAFHVNAGASRFGGQMFFDNTNTTTGTTGAQTINKAAGEVNFAAAATTLVVTNSLATTTSNIFVQVYGTDATATSARVTKASGSFTITLNAAATAETKVAFWVIN